MNAAVGSFAGNGWPARFAGLCALLVGIVALYWPSALSLHALWMDAERTTYTHGYLIAAVCIALLWRERDVLQGPLRQYPQGALLLLPLGVAWLCAFYAGIQVGHEMLLPMLLWAAVLTVFGVTVARRFAFAFAYLYFAMSFWDVIGPVAQWGTVYAIQQMLRVVGVTAYFEENRVQLPAGTFEIVGGCSGLHFIIVGVALAALLGELRRDDWKMRVKLVALMLALAIATNWIRVFVIIVAGHLTHMQHYLVKVSHYGFGWSVFAGALLIFFLLERRMPLSASGAERARAMSRSAAQSGAPSLRVAAIVALAVLAAGLPRVADSFIAGTAPAMMTATLPQAAQPWRGPQSRNDDDWNPVFAGADATQQGTYVRDAAGGRGEVELYMAWFATQRQGKELGGYGNQVAGVLPVSEQGMEQAAERTFSSAILGAAAGPRWVLWSTYRVGDRGFSSPLRAQLQYSLHAVTHLRAPVSQVIAARARCAPDCAAATRQLQDFFESAGVLR